MTEGAFGPEHVNVADQRRDPDSLLSFVETLIRRYRESPELGWTPRAQVLDQPHPAVLALRSTWTDASTVTLHNLGKEALAVPLELPDLPEGTRLVDLLCQGTTEVDAKGRAELTLAGYGYRWLRVEPPGSRRLL